MGFKKILFLSLFIISIVAVNCVVFAEDVLITGSTPEIAISNQEPALTQEKNDTQWAWGEVMNLDTQAKMLTIKYLDYEVDQEKELLLIVDDKTTFENVKGLDELNLKDTLSVDYYMTGLDNKNIAKNISLEKPDALMPLTVQPEEALVEVPAAAGGEDSAPAVAAEPAAAAPAQVAPVLESEQAPAAPEASGQAQ